MCRPPPEGRDGGVDRDGTHTTHGTPSEKGWVRTQRGSVVTLRRIWGRGPGNQGRTSPPGRALPSDDRPATEHDFPVPTGGTTGDWRRTTRPRPVTHPSPNDGTAISGPDGRALRPLFIPRKDLRDLFDLGTLRVRRDPAPEGVLPSSLDCESSLIRAHRHVRDARNPRVPRGTSRVDPHGDNRGRQTGGSKVHTPGRRRTVRDFVCHGDHPVIP